MRESSTVLMRGQCNLASTSNRKISVFRMKPLLIGTLCAAGTAPRWERLIDLLRGHKLWPKPVQKQIIFRILM